MEIHDYILLALIIISFGWTWAAIKNLQKTGQRAIDQIVKRIRDHEDWHKERREQVLPILKDIEIDKEMKRGERR